MTGMDAPQNEPSDLEALLLSPVGVDAGDLQRVQDRLRKREAALRAVLEGLPDATVAAGRDGRIVFANALAEGLFGYEHDELIGQPVRDPVAGARARSLHAQHGALLRDRASAAVHDPRGRPAPRRHRVRRRDELGDRRDRGGAAAARDRARHDRAPRGDGAPAAPVAPAGGAVAALGERALSGADVCDLAQEAVERMRETLPRRARGRDAGWRAAGRLGRARRGRAAVRDSHRRGGVRRHLRGRRWRAWRRGGELPARRSRTCSQPRWAGCAARSGCATTRSTTR